MAMSYERLIHEHAEIDKLSHRLEIEVEKSGPDPQCVAALLGELSLAVKEHLAAEDRSVYEPLIGTKHDKGWRAEVDFEAAFQALETDWTTYLADWVTADSIEHDWMTFAEETRGMMGRLRQRVREETDLIYPMALQRGFIRLRDSVA